jgi:hypothetical protein
VVVVIVAAVGGSHSTSSDTTGTSNPAVQGSHAGGQSSKQSPGHQVLIDHRGSGQWTSPKFTGPSDWTLRYSYDCSNFGQAGNFAVDIQGGDQGFSTSGVNELKMKGSGATSVHDASGPGVYLTINSECNWHVKAES